MTVAHTDDDRIDEQAPSSPREGPKACELMLCAWDAAEIVKHPQRGDMAVCQLHARNIRALPKARFVGQGEIAQ